MGLHVSVDVSCSDMELHRMLAAGEAVGHMGSRDRLAVVDMNPV
jgi:hypothetical protein